MIHSEFSKRNRGKVGEPARSLKKLVQTLIPPTSVAVVIVDDTGGGYLSNLPIMRDRLTISHLDRLICLKSISKTKTSGFGPLLYLWEDLHFTSAV